MQSPKKWERSEEEVAGCRVQGINKGCAVTVTAK